jgi:hypothetical protein
MYERLYSKINFGEAYYASVRNIVEDARFTSFMMAPFVRAVGWT